jgi:uncharacterized protein (DUF1697 family)
MASMIALLRGVNVGGRSSLSMADLRAAAESCGFEHVRTYIQSGNLLFSSRASARRAAGQLRRAIAAGTGVDPEVVVLTRDELAAVVDRNPFLRRGADPAHLHVVFLDGNASLGPLDVAAYAPEEAVADERQIYLFLPDGIGRSKLAADLSRGAGRAGTARSWRTVTKLLALAGEPA